MADIAVNTICQATSPNVIGFFFNPIGRDHNGSGRMCFWAKGLIWVFYRSGLVDGASWVYYRTSSDGVAWSGATQVRLQDQQALLNMASSFCVVYDSINDKIHYAYTSVELADNIYYRMGTPETNGTITWAAIEQVAVAGVGGSSMFGCHINIDSDGFPWIGYNQDPPNGVYVNKSSTRDGTWNNDAGFPHRFGVLVGCNRPVICPLTDSKVYVCWAREVAGPPATLEGQVWDGAWVGAVEAICGDAVEDEQIMAAIPEGDDVHLVYLLDAPNDILYRKRTYGVGWSASSSVAAGVGNQAVPLLTMNLGTHQVYCVWEQVDIIKYNIMTPGGVWAAPVQWIDETVDDIYIWSPVLSPPGFGLWCGVLYARLLASPFDVRFAALAMDYAHSKASVI